MRPDTFSEDDKHHLTAAIDAAVRNIESGGGPFGAVLVAPGGKEYASGNRVTANNDPTAHAEVMAIRRACADMQTFDLTGSVLYSSCEPCPMCATAARWARVARVVFAADRDDAAAAGFDDRAFYDLLAQPDDLIRRAPHQKRLAPFHEWAANLDRVDY